MTIVVIMQRGKMMRLIDADTLEIHEILFPMGNGKYDYIQIVYKNDIDATPTIKSEHEQTIKDCRNCKYGQYNDHYGIPFCYNPDNCTDWNLWEESKKDLPSVQLKQQEITEQQAIEYLQLTGWLQNHDREMYESGLKKGLSDDSGSYDSLILCEDTISRKTAIEVINELHDKPNAWLDLAVDALEKMPSAQPEPCDDPRADVYYLAEKIGIHQLYTLVVELRGEPEPCEDAVSRKEAVREAKELFKLGECHADEYSIVGMLNSLPSVQPEYKMDEWCTDCKEYDHERHCCPRFNKVIRETVEEYKAEHPDHIADDSKMVSLKQVLDEIARWIGYLDEDMIYRIQTGMKKLPSAHPEDKCSECDAWNKYKNYPREQRWILCSERLPENDDFVVVTVLDERGDTPYRYSDFGWYLGSAKCWIVDAEQRTDIIAWMPLPEPYAERRTNE